MREKLPPGIEQRGDCTYRIGFQITEQLETGPVRHWIRETHTYPAELTEEQRILMAQADLRLLKAKHTHLTTDVSIAAPPGPAEITVAQLLTLWLHVDIAGQSADYEKTVESLVRLHILPHLGHLRAAELTPLQITVWVNLLGKTKARNASRNLSPRSVRHIYATAARAFTWARHNRLITASPFEDAESPKARRHRPAFLDDDQAVQLLRYLADEPDMSFRCAVLLALMCSLRLSEVGALTWSDVDWTHGTITLSRAYHQTPAHGRSVDDTKTEASVRIISAPAALLTLLHETRRHQREQADKLGARYHDHDLIVCAPNGEHLNKDTPSKQWRKFADRHGFTGVTFHNLRTSHATILLASQVDAVSVASRMGHADAVTTYKYYAGLLPDRERRSADVMDRLAARAARRSSVSTMAITGKDDLITQDQTAIATIRFSY